MPTAWMHIQWNTYGSWLPGDARGFRSREHRIHSSGSYKRPPPPKEHTGLYRHTIHAMTGTAVTLPPDIRMRVLESIREKSGKALLPIEAIAVSGQHVHCLMFVEPQEVDRQVGRLKRHSSHAIRDIMPGTVWSAGCNPEHVDDQEFWLNVVAYILDHAKEGAAVWRRDACERSAAAQVWNERRAQNFPAGHD